MFDWLKPKGLGFIPDVAVPDTFIPIDKAGTCKFCEKQFYKKTKAQKYCSDKCRQGELDRARESRNGNVSYYRQCLCCKKWFIADSKTRLYCNNMQCHGSYGRSREDLLDINELEYMFEKYNWTCQICLIRYLPNELAIHHVIPLALNGSTLENNLVLLCHECHRTFHKRDMWDRIRQNPNCAWDLLYERRKEVCNARVLVVDYKSYFSKELVVYG